MIMLPIPVPIIGSNKRLFIPLLYFAVTASICYIFLVALVKVNPSTLNHSNSIYNRRKYHFIQNLKKRETRENNQEIKSQTHTQDIDTYRRREADIELFYDTYKTKGRLNSTDSSASWKSKKKKEYKNQYPENNKKQNGTRRSNPTKIWAGYQNNFRIIDNLASSIQPWPSQSKCRQFRIHFAKKHTFKPRALVSFPGSGNSWLRYMIECSTGFFTGSVFNDTEIYSSGLLGEFRAPNDGSTIVQKTHHDTIRYASLKTQQAYVKLTELMFLYRGILLIRNPYDALISYWNFVETRDHKGYADKHYFSPQKWQNFVTSLIPRWSSLITSWVDHSQSFLIVLYENVKKNPRSELIRILEYLDQPVNTSRLDCLLKDGHVEGPFHRLHENFTNNSEHWTSSVVRESETKERYLDFAQVLPDWNSKSRIDDQHSDQNIFPINSFLHPFPSLDLIVQDNIRKINRFFEEKDIPIFLNYDGPSSNCCTH